MTQKPDRTGKPFERLVAAVQKKLDKNSTVTWDKMINGRQIDVCVEGRVGSSNVLVIIECRDHTDTLGIDHIDRLESIQRDTEANKAILVTRVGYTKNALEKAYRTGIDTCTLGPAQAEDFPKDTFRKFQFDIVSIGIDIKNLELEFTDGRRESCGLFYRLIDNNGQTEFLDRIIKGWLQKEGRHHPMGEMLHLALDPPLRLLKDDEEPYVVKIHCYPLETRGPALTGLWCAPEEWVFRKILPNEVQTEKQFFLFDDIDLVAKSAKKGEPIKP